MKTLAERYELGEELGHGGMAIVYRANDRVLGRVVAVKVLSPELARDEGFVKRFRREARAAAGLNNPNIVAIFDHGVDRRSHYIVMEHVEGATLADVLAEEAPLPPARAAAIAAAVARALEAAHEHGMIHRDVKPGNVLLANGDGVKVTDFGIARTLEEEHLTMTGTVLGTASYISPEQARGEAVDARSDLYSLGCVMYEMLTGRPPFAADSAVATAHLHVSQDPAPPSEVRPGIPAPLEALILRALSKDPGQRPPSAGAMAQTLAGFAGTDAAPTEAMAVAGAPPRTPTTPMPAVDEQGSSEDRRRWPWLVAAGAGVLGGLLLLWLLSAGTDGPPPAPEEPEATGAAGTPAEEEEEEALSVEDAYLALVTVVTEGVARDEMTPKAAEDVTERANKAMAEYRDADLEDALEELEKTREKAADRTQKGEIQPARAGSIMEAIDLLERAMRTHPPTEPEDDDDDDESSSGKPGRGLGRGRGGGSG